LLAGFGVQMGLEEVIRLLPSGAANNWVFLPMKGMDVSFI